MEYFVTRHFLLDYRRLGGPVTLQSSTQGLPVGGPDEALLQLSVDEQK